MKERKGIMGACEYSILAMQDIKRQLLDNGSENHESAWAMGGLTVVLVSRLLQTCEEVFKSASINGTANAIDDISEIQVQFHQFIEEMKNHE